VSRKVRPYQTYFLDVARSDLLGELANEAVLPAVQDFWKLAIILCFFLFVVITFTAVRLILKPVKLVCEDVESISPDKLEQRLGLDHVPSELIPIVNALNQALSRVEVGYKQQQQFVADAAHELRTPLSILSNRLELEVPESSSKHQLLIDIGHMSRIVEQLLDLARAQNLPVARSDKADIVAVTKDVCSLLVPLALEKGQHLELETQSIESFATINAGDLSVVEKNLVENAIKHSPDKAHIRVSIMNGRISVEDSGPGILEHCKSDIFKRFFRVNQSNVNGSGLGLSIVEETIVKNGADISVERSDSLGGSLVRPYPNRLIPYGNSFAKNVASRKKSRSFLTIASSRLSRATYSSRGEPLPLNACSCACSASRLQRVSILGLIPISTAT